MKFKKSKASLFLAVASLLALTGCGGSTSQDGGSSSTSTSTESSISSQSSTSTSTSDSKVSSVESSSVEVSSQSSVDEVANARKAALEYFDSIDLTLYREAEATKIQQIIEKAKAQINLDTATVESIESIVESVRNYVATQKTDAQYQEEEKIEAEKALAKAKETKKAAATVKDPNQYRSEQLGGLIAEQNTLYDQIDAAKTMTELDAISLDSFNQKVASAKTNADYMMQNEYDNHREDSKWPLVNEHADMWTREGNVVHTNSVGYSIIDGNEYGDCVTSLKVNSASNIDILGVMRVTQNPTGSGVDGYLINFVANSSSQFVQIYYLKNCYGQEAAVCDYIGGWVYPEQIKDTEFRIEFSGTNCFIYEEQEYQKTGTEARHEVVDLTAGGKYETYQKGKIGLVSWTDTQCSIELTKVCPTDAPVSGKETMKKFSKQYKDTIDLSLYRNEEKANIQAAIDALNAEEAKEDATYESIDAKVNALKEVVKAQKTDAQYLLEEAASNVAAAKQVKIASLPTIDEREYPAESATQAAAIRQEAIDAINALDSVDAVNAFDYTPYQTRIDALPTNATKFMDNVFTSPSVSPWDLVTEHANTWTQNKNIAKTGAVAYQLNNQTYSDFEMVMKVDTTSNTNFIGFMVRTTYTATGGLNGYLVCIHNQPGEQWVQVWYLGNGYGPNGEGATYTYLNGVVYGGNVVGTAFRISFAGNICKIYDEAEYQSGNTTPAANFDLSNGGTITAYSSGLMGPINWDGNPADITLSKLIIK